MIGSSRTRLATARLAPLTILWLISREMMSSSEWEWGRDVVFEAVPEIRADEGSCDQCDWYWINTWFQGSVTGQCHNCFCGSRSKIRINGKFLDLAQSHPRFKFWKHRDDIAASHVYDFKLLRFVKGKASVLSPGKAAFPTPDAVWNPYKAAFEEQPESPIEQKESRVEKFGDDVGDAADDFDDYDDFEYDPGGDWR